MADGFSLPSYSIQNQYPPLLISLGLASRHATRFSLSLSLSQLSFIYINIS